LGNHPEGLSRGQLSEKLSFILNDKTLQRQLGSLVNEGRIAKKGDRKATRYHPTLVAIKGQIKDNPADIFSVKSKKLLEFLDTPLHGREKVSYNRDFLNPYVSNESAYVPIKIRHSLFKKGKRFYEQLAAGTYAQQISQRLLIDLSYNSSRLEGNTYSRLDTQKLVEEGITAEGKVHEETVMIMNHKEAILFLVENAQDIELKSMTIRNLHHLQP